MKLGQIAPLILVAAATPGLARETTVPTLQPSGKWLVDYQQNMCVLQRSYGTGPQAVTFGFRPVPLSSQMEAVLVRPASGGQSYRAGKGGLTLDSRSIPADFQSYYVAKPGVRVITYYVDVAIDEVIGAQNITVSGDQLGPVTLALGGSAGAKQAIDKCQDDLLAGWGVDVPALKALRKNAQSVTAPHSVFTVDDYPAEAIRKGQQGRTVALVTIGGDGRPLACRAVAKATPLLDDTTCHVLTSRLRYTPAVGGDGNPASGYVVVSIRWQLPQ